jgi:hypothetical protein
VEDSIRKAFLDMIRAYPGGWDAAAGALCMSRMALENRIYERKGQAPLVEHGLALQALSGATRFAEAVAALSGGVFMPLPEPSLHGRGDLFEKFAELYAELGKLSEQMKAAVADGEIDKRKRIGIAATGQDIHRVLQELLQLTFAVYCRPGPDRPGD